MSIEFNCLHCGKALSTSEDKAGRRAKCPQCGEVVVVPNAAATAVTEADDEELLEPPPLPTERGTKNCPMCGEKVPISARRCTYCGEELVAEPGVTSRVPRKLEAGEVMSASWEHFKDNMGMLIVTNLVYGLLVLVTCIPVFGLGFAIAMQADQGGGDPDPILLLMILPAMLPPFLTACFLMPGYSIVFLDVARGEPAELGKLFSGGKFFLRSILSTVVFGLAVGVGFALCLLPGILLALRYWPYMYVLVDEDRPGLDCLSRSAEITKGNWGAVLLLGIVGLAMNAAAQAVCGLLQLFTAPLQSMFFSTAYVKMTGQERLR